MKQSEAFNVLTHLVGAIASPVGIAILIAPALRDGDWLRAAGFLVYGFALLATYTASVLFHTFRGETRETFRRYDRMAIYVMIAGTYTPLTLVSLPPDFGRPLLAVVWLLAVAGVWFERRAAHLPTKKPVTVSLYLAMGWLSLIAIQPLVKAIGVPGVALIFIGGGVYTLGALLLRYRLVPKSHEVWHVLVLIGSACHFAVLLFYVS